MATEYFVLLDSMTPAEARSRDKVLNAATLLSLPPTAASPIIMGEWFDIDATVTTEQWKRATGALPAFPYYLPSGEPTPQIIHKAPLLMGAPFEADTKVMTAGAIAVGSPLKVGNVTIAGTTKSGLVLHNGAADADFVQGYCMRLAANNNGFLRFYRVGPHRMA